MSIVSSKIEVEIRGKSYTFDRVAGSGRPTKEAKTTVAFKALRRFFFREELGICGGLDLWKCAGTGAIERARIFWNRAEADAWATLQNHNRRN